MGYSANDDYLQRVHVFCCDSNDARRIPRRFTKDLALKLLIVGVLTSSKYRIHVLNVAHHQVFTKYTHCSSFNGVISLREPEACAVLFKQTQTLP